MKRAFELNQKAFFIIFKGLSIAKNCPRPESAPSRFKALGNSEKSGKSQNLLEILLPIFSILAKIS